MLVIITLKPSHAHRYTLSMMYWDMTIQWQCWVCMSVMIGFLSQLTAVFKSG